MDIQLIKRSEKENEFVFSVFAENKIAELHAQSWPDQLKKQLVTMQFDAFELAMKNEYPCHEDYIITVDSENAGRLQLDKNQERFRILNISLLSAFQNKGIGSKILQKVTDEATLINKPIFLEVDKTNPAFKLYQKLGFLVYDETGIKYSMKFFPN